MGKKQKNAPQQATAKDDNKQIAQQTLGFWENTRLHLGIIAALAFLLYANTLTHLYCQDDAIVITENMFTQKGFAGFSGILSEDTFFGFFKEGGKENLVAGGRYRPFTLLMFATEYQFFGNNPFIGHLLNVVFFALLCVLFYKITARLLSLRADLTENAVKIAFVAAIVFALHPIHTEAVANIKGRDEIMALLGSLGAVYCALKYIETQQKKWLVFNFAIFLCGLLSKENTVTFVVILPLALWIFANLDLKSLFLNTMPLLLATLLFLILRGGAIGNQFGGEQKELLNNPFLKLVGNTYVPFSINEKFATITYTLGEYVRLLFFPFPLTHDYYPRHIDIMSFSDIKVIFSLVLYLVLAYLAFIGIKRKTVWGFGIAVYLLSLSIVSNIVFPVGTNMAERFLFMPSVGFALAIAWCVVIFIKKETVIIGFLATLSLIFGFKTIDRNAAWKDNFTIFTTDIAVSKNSAKLQTSVGGTLIERYGVSTNKVERAQKMATARAHLQKAIALHPLTKQPYLLWGNAFFYEERYDSAIVYYKKALAFDANFSDAQNNLFLSAREGGKKAGQVENNLPKATELLEYARSLRPNDAEVLSYLGTVYGMQGRVQDLISVLEQALKMRKDKNDCLNIIRAYQQTGNLAKAAEYEQLLKNIQ